MAEPAPTAAPPAPICVVEGCTNSVSIRTHASICEEHWFKLPMELRKRWWKETAYGRRAPSGELMARINKTLAQPGLLSNPPEGVTKGWADPISMTPQQAEVPDKQAVADMGEIDKASRAKRKLSEPAWDSELGKQQAGAPSPIDGKR